MKTATRLTVVAVVVAAAVAVISLKPGGSTNTTAPMTTSPATGIPRLLELGSDRCQACKAMAPVLDELRAAYPGKLKVDFIDVWVDKTAVETYRVDLIPTQVYYDGAGRELGRKQGFHSRNEIVETFKSFGIRL